MARPSKYPWAEVERRFVEAEGEPPTLAALAEEYSIPYAEVRRRSMLCKWSYKRDNYETRMQQSRQAVQIQDYADRFRRIDTGTVALCEALLKRIGDHVRSDELKPSEIAQISSSLRTLYSLSQDARGEIGVALTTLAERGIIDHDVLPQIADILQQGEQALSESLYSIFRGDCPD